MACLIILEPDSIDTQAKIPYTMAHRRLSENGYYLQSLRQVHPAYIAAGLILGQPPGEAFYHTVLTDQLH